MTISVTTKVAELVGASERTPAVSLLLSAIDSRPFLGFFQQVLHVYRHGQEPAKVIKAAISNVLVAYFPITGRLGITKDQELEVNCNGEGIYFVEALADCELEDVNYMDCPPYAIPIDQLLPSPPLDVQMHELIFLIQVTQFKCDGFTVGIKFNHAFFDATGIVQFVNAVAETARGLPQPTTKPIWFRESVVDPQQFSLTFSEAHAALAASSTDFEEYVIDLSQDQINQLKNNFANETGEMCSTFDMLTALIWQCRVKAMNLEPQVTATLVFPINMRRTLCRMLPSDGGYYGNYLYIAVVTDTSENICGGSLAEITKIVRNAKDKFFKKFSTWLNDDPKDEPVEFEVSYLSLCMTDWRHIGILDIDYGWGAPTNLALDLNDIEMPVGGCEMMDSPVHKGGVRLWTQCVIKEHFQGFVEALKMGPYCIANHAE